MDKHVAQELFAQASANFRQGEYDQALKVLHSLARAFPKDSAPLYAAALCLERLDRRDEAVRLCDKLVREHHSDKAVILKARLITTPSDPPPDSELPEIALLSGTALQEKRSSAARPHSAPVTSSGATWPLRFLAIVVAVAFLTILPLLIAFLAQPDVSMAALVPMMYDERIIALYALTLFAVTAVITYAATFSGEKASALSVPGRMGGAACCGLLCLVPVAGWFVGLLALWKGLGCSLRTSVGVIVLAVALQVVAGAGFVLALGILAASGG